ncbi:putative metal-dependent phosphotriesterase family hydrolase [Arthrobacter sp. UYNi723]
MSVKTGKIRTVLGDIEPGELGKVDYHEHLFQVSPLLPGDELDSEEKSRDEASLLFAAGIGAMIEATPTGLGQRPAAVARISQSTGLKVVHTTGAHHQGHYPDGHELRERTIDQLAERFISDVQDGFKSRHNETENTPDGRPVRAGIVKAGIRYWTIGPFETRVLAAVAETHLATNVAVMIHLDYGSAAHEVLDRLEGMGVAPGRVVLAHIDRNLDPDLHADLAARGAYLGYDGPARHREAPDSEIIKTIASVAEAGHADRIVLGGDVARASRYLAYGGLPGLEYLPLRFLPRLEKALGGDFLHQALTSNPSKLLTF